MGDVSLTDLPATAIYTAVGVMAHQLGIDGFQLESSRKQLTSAVNVYARVGLDADFRRISLRTFVLRPPTLARPGATYLELETNPDAEIPDSTLLVVGPRSLDEDLRLLAEGSPASEIIQLDPKLRVPNVSAALVTRLGNQLRLLGTSTVDVLGQRMVPGGFQWLLGTELGAESVREVSTIAEAVGVAPYQLTMLGALHGDLATKGCLVTLACTPSAIRSEVTIEYRDIAWEQVVTTASRLRAAKSGGFGVLAGAFAAERADYLEITFRSDQVPRVRAAIEHNPKAS